jgi:hypothetical protein
MAWPYLGEQQGHVRDEDGGCDKCKECKEQQKRRRRLWNQIGSPSKTRRWYSIHQVPTITMFIFTVTIITTMPLLLTCSTNLALTTTLMAKTTLLAKYAAIQNMSMLAFTYSNANTQVITF